MAAKKKTSQSGQKSTKQKPVPLGPNDQRKAAAATPSPGDQGTVSFDREKLAATIISIPLLQRIAAVEQALASGAAVLEDDELAPVQDVIIEVNLNYPGGRERAKQAVAEQIEQIHASAKHGKAPKIHERKSEGTHYVFAKLHYELIRQLAAANDPLNMKPSATSVPPAVYKIWPNFKVSPFICKTIGTVKVNALHTAFGARGKNIVWAVVDSGVDGGHPHFAKYGNLKLPSGLYHRDFTSDELSPGDADDQSACVDVFGHGTHVAGIIAGEVHAKAESKIIAKSGRRNEHGDKVETLDDSIPCMAGMAPESGLLSLKVLDDRGQGATTNIIAALQYVLRLNDHGRMIRVHGVNLSLGYGFDAEWFACGQSPLCVEVNRLVQSGVVVVVAAGNTGYGVSQTLSGRGAVRAGLDVSINDPGNADEAITVGSTHRDMPHTYGVSYFSSKGPTGDGRMKPDILAPGERILSCASGTNGVTIGGEPPLYREDSGTSMAAPHVSGVVAAFLSVRTEFIGKPQRMKQILRSTATDLGRAPYFQGSGLVDAMRAIQSV